MGIAFGGRGATRSGARERRSRLCQRSARRCGARVERGDLRATRHARRCWAARRTASDYPLRRYYLPEPQLALGRALRGTRNCGHRHIRRTRRGSRPPLSASGVAAQSIWRRCRSSPVCTAARGRFRWRRLRTVFHDRAGRARARSAICRSAVSVIGRIERRWRCIVRMRTVARSHSRTEDSAISAEGKGRLHPRPI